MLLMNQSSIYGQYPHLRLKSIQI